MTQIERNILLIRFAKQQIQYRGDLELKIKIEDSKPHIVSYPTMTPDWYRKEIKNCGYAITWALNRIKN